jgi:hypothetical protein
MDLLAIYLHCLEKGLESVLIQLQMATHYFTHVVMECMSCLKRNAEAVEKGELIDGDIVVQHIVLETIFQDKDMTVLHDYLISVLMTQSKQEQDVQGMNEWLNSKVSESSTSSKTKAVAVCTSAGKFVQMIPYMDRVIKEACARWQETMVSDKIADERDHHLAMRSSVDSDVNTQLVLNLLGKH